VKIASIILYMALINVIRGSNMILESIRQAIAKSGKTRYQISKDTGIKQTVLFRIVHGGSCSLETADKLCECLRLELRGSRVKPRRRKER
jgi:hypothetical protein